MQQVSIKDLRDDLARIIDEVAIAGKRFEVTKFGKRRAAIVPIDDVSKNASLRKRVDFSQFPAFGMWKDRKDMRDPATWVQRLRKKESNLSQRRNANYGTSA